MVAAAGSNLPAPPGDEASGKSVCFAVDISTLDVSKDVYKRQI